MSEATSRDDSWAAGWAPRTEVAKDLRTLRDCDTCVPFTAAQLEHLDALIRIYAPDDVRE